MSEASVLTAPLLALSVAAAPATLARAWKAAFASKPEDVTRGVIAPLKEPVSIAKALLGGETVSLVTAPGGETAAFLVNIQLTSWNTPKLHTDGFISGFNYAAKWMQNAMQEKAASEAPMTLDISDKTIFDDASDWQYHSKRGSIYNFSPSGLVTCVQRIISNATKGEEREEPKELKTVKIYETYTGQNGWLKVSQDEYDRTRHMYPHRIRLDVVQGDGA